MSGFYYEDSYDTTAETLLARMGTGSALDNFYGNGEILITIGPEKIKDAIYDILDTPYGTRFFLPTYGCRVHEVLMEQNDFVARDLAESYVEEALKIWEPRITVISVTAESIGTELRIVVIYKINSLGMKDSFVYTMEKRVPELL